MYEIYFLILLIFYLFLHSLFAHNRFKKWAYRNFVSEKYYRLFFSFYAILFLVPVYFYYFKAEKNLLFSPSLIAIIIGYIISSFSVLLFAIAFRVYKIEEFLGWDRLKNSQIQKYPLNVKGLNGISRHPLYTYSYTLMFGLFLIHPTDILLEASLIIGVYMPIGIFFEEQKLVEEYGEDYIKYMRKVPKLIPSTRKLKDKE